MSVLLNNLKKYEKSYKVVSIDALDAEDLQLLSSGWIVKSTYGTSVQLRLKEGGSMYIPIDSRDETYKIGDEVDLTRMLIKTLHKDGKPDDIQRVVFKDKEVNI